MKKINIGQIFLTNDDKLVTKNDKKSSHKSRFVTVIKKLNEDNLVVLKVYTLKTCDNRVKIEKEAGFKKESVIGENIITHELVNGESKKISLKNGNLKVKKRMIKSSTIDEAINKLSEREKRKLNRAK